MSFDMNGVAASTLPEEMKSMSVEERKVYIQEKQTARTNIKSQIKDLNRQRESFVAIEKAKDVTNTGNKLDDAIIGAIIEQAEQKNFRFEKEIN